MIRAKLETRHFTFEAYGKTETEAMDTLRFAWNSEHRRQYPDAVSFDECISDGDIGFLNVEIGDVYRDGEWLRPTANEMSVAIMQGLADNALPLDDDEWGSERQIDAENLFFHRLEPLLPANAWENLTDYCLKATTEEMMAAGMAALKKEMMRHRSR